MTVSSTSLQPFENLSDAGPEVSEMTREDRMVILRRDETGRITVWCDPEIADIVSALNNGGVPTVASCSGHGQDGIISLIDGRELVVKWPLKKNA